MTTPQSLKEIDSTLGKCVRLYRTLKGMTQSELGQQVGVSFQQIQKYENGSTRISASQLLRLSQALDVSVIDFYVRVDELEKFPSLRPNHRNVEMLLYFQNLPHPIQKSLLDLVKTLAPGE